MHVLLPTTLALATFHNALAQKFPRGDPISLSSVVGPFSGPTLIFAPGISAYDFISAVGSTGPSDETTIFKAYVSSTMADSENRSNDIPGDGKVGKQAYATFTWGPATYEESGSLPYVPSTKTETKGEEGGDGGSGGKWTQPPISPPWYSKGSARQIADNEARATTIRLESATHTYLGGPQMTQCAYTTEPRKAVCTYAETDAMEGATRESESVETLGEEGWISVYVLLDPMAVTTMTEEVSAEETLTGSMTTVASAGSGSGSGSRGGSTATQAPATSTQGGAAAEVTAWVNAAVVVAAAAAIAM